MQNVTVNNDFRITIPKEFRESLGLKPGQKMIVVERDHYLELIPLPSISEARGMLKGKGIESTIVHDPDRY